MKEMDEKVIIERIEQERNAALARSEKLERQLAKSLLEQAAGEGLRVAGVTRTKLILPHLVDRLRIDMTLEDHPRTVVLDRFGHETGMTVEDLVSEFKGSEDFAGLFEPASKAKRGSADDGAGGPPARNPFLRGRQFNATEQAKLLRQDPAKAERLRAEADAATR